MELRPSEIYRGRKFLLIGGTGFLGKVSLSMLLDRFPQVGKVYLTVRALSQAEAESRFWNEVVQTPPFLPLRAKHGGEFDSFMRRRIEVVRGDVTERDIGLADTSFASDLDLIINAAGKVTFNPPLDSAMRANVIGTRNVLEFARRMDRPALLHVSTCFVAGNHPGTVWEDYLPGSNGFGPNVSVPQELAGCDSLVARVAEEAKRLAIESPRLRKAWMRSRLTELAVERARALGWPNIYTYTKALGEHVVAEADGIVRTVVRPSIVESAISYPFPGWNEGFTTTAPLTFLALRSQVRTPAAEKLILDVTPVDQVAAVILAVAAAACVGRARSAYQISTGDQNPLLLRRAIELIGMRKRELYLSRRYGSRLLNQLVARMEHRPVSGRWFDRTSAPILNTLIRATATLLGPGGSVSAPRLAASNSLRARVSRLKLSNRQATALYRMFRPFTVDNSYLFRADNVRELYRAMPEEEQQLVPWRPGSIDWFDYWLNVHMPGLEKWIFPRLEEDLRVRSRRADGERELAELNRKLRQMESVKQPPPSLSASSAAPAPLHLPRPLWWSGEEEAIEMPELVRLGGTYTVELLHQILYNFVLRTSWAGRENIPVHTNFLVAANHSSHLDMGLIKMALGDAGRDLVVLAAADYFFNTRLKSTIAENFTTLVPLERIRPRRRTLLQAGSYLETGHSALIFPEGTRSRTGEIAEFKPVVSYLALTARVGILPVHLSGTFKAFPKGARMFRARTVGAKIGRFLPIEHLEQLVRGLPHALAQRLIAALVRHEIVNLRRGVEEPFDAEAFVQRWSNDRRAVGEEVS